MGGKPSFSEQLDGREYKYEPCNTHVAFCSPESPSATAAAVCSVGLSSVSCLQPSFYVYMNMFSVLHVGGRSLFSSITDEETQTVCDPTRVIDIVRKQLPVAKCVFLSLVYWDCVILALNSYPI